MMKLCPRVANWVSVGAVPAPLPLQRPVPPAAAETERAVHQRLHDTVLAEDVVILGAVPIDFAVDVVAIEGLGARN